MEQNPNARYGMVVFFQWLCSCHHLMQFNFTGTSNVCRDLWSLGSIFSRFVTGIPLCPQSLALKMLCCTNELWSAALRQRIGVYFPKNHRSCEWSYSWNSHLGSGHHLRVSIFSVCCCFTVNLEFSLEFYFLCQTVVSPRVCGPKYGQFLFSKLSIPLEWERRNPVHFITEN